MASISIARVSRATSWSHPFTGLGPKVLSSVEKYHRVNVESALLVWALRAAKLESVNGRLDVCPGVEVAWPRAAEAVWIASQPQFALFLNEVSRFDETATTDGHTRAAFSVSVRDTLSRPLTANDKHAHPTQSRA